MRSLQDEIAQAQRELSCPICSRTFGLREIQLRSFGEGVSAELSVVCSRGHFPVILIVPVVLKEVLAAGPITKRELRKVNTTLEQINNNFEELSKHGFQNDHIERPEA